MTTPAPTPLAVAAAPRPTTLAAAVVAAAALVALIAALVVGPVERGPGFHFYADQRTVAGVPRVGDVVSNAAFLAAAAWGLGRWWRGPAPRAWLVAWAGLAVGGIGLGSAGYHAWPGDGTLAADWLPIVLALAAVSGAVVADRAGRAAGRAVALGLAAAAVAGVAVWYLGGGTAGGDLRWYVATQLVGVASPALVVLVTRGGRIDPRLILAATALFVLARVAGAHDRALLDAVGLGGHSLKHLLAAGAAALALRALT